VTLLLYTLSLPALPRDGGGDGNALFPGVSLEWTLKFELDVDLGLVWECLVVVLEAGVGLDISRSGSRAGKFASRGESGEGELRSGDEERGEETCGV